MMNAEELILESLAASDDLDTALRAAARLLGNCKCQYQRRHEAEAALKLAENAAERWDHSKKQLAQYAALRTQGNVSRA